jgi:hypothetical protein
VTKVAFSRFTNCRVGHGTGKLTLEGHDETGAEIEVALPLGMYFGIAAPVRRAIYTGIREHADKLKAQEDEVVSFEPRLVTAGTLARGPDVLLTFDRGMETEIAFRLAPDTADQIARDLV